MRFFDFYGRVSFVYVRRRVLDFSRDRFFGKSYRFFGVFKVWGLEKVCFLLNL